VTVNEAKENRPSIPEIEGRFSFASFTVTSCRKEV